jgi:hypothetical protein
LAAGGGGLLLLNVQEATAKGTSRIKARTGRMESTVLTAG